MIRSSGKNLASTGHYELRSIPAPSGPKQGIECSHVFRIPVYVARSSVENGKILPQK